MKICKSFDQELGIPLEIGACGEMNLAVSDLRKLLLKLVGTMNGIAWGDNGAGFLYISLSFSQIFSTPTIDKEPKKQIRTNFDLRNSSDLLRLVTRTGI